MKRSRPTRKIPPGAIVPPALWAESRGATLIGWRSLEGGWSAVLFAPGGCLILAESTVTKGVTITHARETALSAAWSEMNLCEKQANASNGRHGAIDQEAGRLLLEFSHERIRMLEEDVRRLEDALHLLLQGSSPGPKQEGGK